MITLLTGLLFLLWGLTLLGIVAISNTVLGVLALVVGVAYLISSWVPFPDVPHRRP
jgi:hypothetical protein